MTGTASGVGVIQLSVGGFDRNFSYLLQEQASGDAAIVDPCGDIRVIERAVRASPGLRPRYILLTHGHRDHSSGIAEAKLFFEAPVASHPLCAFRPDIPLNDHQRLPFGDIAIECLHAPGHTTDSVVYRLTDDSALFTGDTLFIDWCGYCEARSMFRTMREVLYPLADTLEVYPGHDYGRYPHRPLGLEKRENPYLTADDYDCFFERLKEL